jgi:hypothetical protein
MSGLVVGTILRHSRARGNARLVLIVIGDCARDDGSGAWPAIGTIAELAGVSVRTAQRAIRETQELGELTIDENGGPKGTHLYSVCMDRLVSNRRGVKLTGVSTEVHRGVNSGIKGVTQVTPDPSFLSRSVIDPSEERERADAPTPLSVQEITDGWNEVVAPLGLPRVVGLSRERRRKLLERLREHSDFDWWQTIFNRISRSKFLRGENSRGWVCTFDFLIKNDSNALKIFEGQYETAEREKSNGAALR